MTLDEVGEGALILWFRFELDEEVEEEDKVEKEEVEEGVEEEEVRVWRARLSTGRCSGFDKVLLNPPTMTTESAESTRRNIISVFVSC